MMPVLQRCSNLESVLNETNDTEFSELCISRDGASAKREAPNVESVWKNRYTGAFQKPM